jgi:hypothetical protein
MRFAAVLPMTDKTVLAAGEVLNEDGHTIQTALMLINPRGRVLAHYLYDAMPGEQITAMIPAEKGYRLASAIGDKEKQTRIIWIDSDFKVTRETVLKDAVYDYVSLGLVPAATGKGVLALVQAVNRKNPADQYGMIFNIDDQGKTVWKRSYRPGIPNIIYGVTPTIDGRYIAAGSIRNEDGRMAGWVLMLAADGTILWQRSYPRGSNAILRMGATKNYLNEGARIILTGQIMPADNNPGAAWVMEIDDTGAPVWQRYLRGGNYDLDGRSLAVYEDGRSTIVANARGTAEGHSDHIRLFTLTPRGQVMEDESYMEGVSAQATSFHLSDDMERVLSAAIQTSNRAEKEARKVELITDAIIRREKESENAEAILPDAEEIQAIEDLIPDSFTPQGWVFAATPLSPYEDPCVVTVAAPAQ